MRRPLLEGKPELAKRRTVQPGRAFGVEARQRGPRARGRIHPNHFDRHRGAFPVGHQLIAGRLGAAVDAGRIGIQRAHLAAGRRHREQPGAALVVGVEIQRPAVQRQVEAVDRAVEARRQHLQLAVDGFTGPAGAGDLIVVVDVFVDRLVTAIHVFAVGREHRAGAAEFTRRELLRLAAVDRHPVQLMPHFVERRLVQVFGRGDHQRPAVGRPGRGQGAFVARPGDQLRAEQQIGGLGAGLGGLHEQARLLFVAP